MVNKKRTELCKRKTTVYATGINMFTHSSVFLKDFLLRP